MMQTAAPTRVSLLRIYEVPIKYRARTREEGKKLKWTDGVLALLILLRVRLVGR
jgi:hypothetical protein